MDKTNTRPTIDRLLSPVCDSLTPESARRLLATKTDPEIQAYMDDMASRHTEGQLTPAETAEYGRYVSYVTFVSIMKAKARALLATGE